LIERDPLLGALNARRKSFTWSELRKDRKLSQVGRDAIELAANYGWTEGLAVSISRGGTRFGLVSLVGHSGDLIGHDRSILCLVSECLLTHIRSLEPKPPFPAPPAGLSNREIDCIRLVALGYSDQEIADQLAISRSTAHQHVEAGRRKLHAKTRAHMAALGVSLGIVESG
jgi:DNA-binding CsgD family transcriptional regulator